VFWRIASDSPLYLSRYRPDVSISRALPLALASSGILLPNRMRWVPALAGDRLPRERLGVIPFPVVIGCIRRAVFSTGFLDSANRSLVSDAGVVSCAFWLQRLSLLRWVIVTMAHHTFACATPQCLLNG
jgi:hypothetical protein